MELVKMKVNITKIRKYDFEEIYQYFFELFNEINLWKDLEGKNIILIKPNMLGAFPIEKAVTTNPVVIEAIVKLLVENNKFVKIGDSPGGTVSYQKVLEFTQIGRIAKKYRDVEIVNFNSNGIVEIDTRNNKFPVSEDFMKADAVINVCKYKTHGLTLFTGAIKNLYGIIPGLKKADYHRKYPNPDVFAEAVVELYDKVKSKLVLNIMDGIWGMEGEGPSKGSPRNFGVIFSSKSATALDYIAAKMMGFKPQNVPIIDKSLKIDQLDASTITVDNIWQNFVFEKVDIVKVQRSRGILILMPSFIKNIFREYFDFYPAFKDSCKKCNICVDSCPIDVITLTKDDKKPSIDYSKCIKCLCCHEMCPYDAVYIKKTMLAKLFMK